MPTLDYKFKPRKYQIPLLKALDSGIRRAICVWHRRSGKDLTAWNHTIAEALQVKGVYYYFLPTYAQGKKVIWESIDPKTGISFLDYIPRELIVQKYETELKVELKNGSLIQIVGSDNIDRIVGTNPIGCVFSEYALMKPNVWDYIRPILKVNGGWALFIFTPRGTNHAWKMTQMAKSNDKWFTQQLSILDTNVLTEQDMKEEKEEGTPQDIIDQEYYCKFIEGGASFFRGVQDNRIPEKDEYDPTHKYQMGVDLAKHQDYTVITVIDLMNFRVMKQERFNQMDYVTQKAKIEAMYLRYGKPLIYMDSTGVGEPIYDDLCHRRLRVEPFHFTEGSRKDLLTNLQMLIEQGKIGLPDNDILLGELQSFQYELSDRGKLKIQVPSGSHDDTVFSLALACWNLPNNPRPKRNSIQFMLNQEESKLSKVTRYD